MALRFEETKERAIIRAVLRQPKIYASLHDDYGPGRDEFEPLIGNPLVKYFAIWDEDQLMGIAMLNIHSRVKWEVHNAILPHVGWKKRVAICQSFFLLAWGRGCKRIVGRVPESNRYALRFNEAIGMERVGVEHKSFLKDGWLQDEVYFGLSAPGLS